MTGQAADLRPFELGYAGTELRRALGPAQKYLFLHEPLVGLVLAGTKTATAGLRSDHVPFTDDPLPPRVGERFALLDVDDRPVGIVETTEVRIVPAGEIDTAFARDEGEGFETVADWRAAHVRFWPSREIDDGTPIVAERFRLVERLP